MKKSHRTRFLSLILALVLSFSLCAPAFAAGQFSDVPETHWAYGDIMECASQGVVSGFADGTFRPDDSVSSAQFISMLTRIFYADEVAAVTVPAGQPWYYAYVKAAENVRITTKLASIDDAPMSRYEMAAVLDGVIFDKAVTLLVSAMLEYQYRQGLINEKPTSDWYRQREEAAKQAIKDWDSIPTQYGGAVAECYALGALTGMEDGNFSGTQSMTRAQACIVITRMMDLVQGKLPTESSAPAAPAQPEQPQQPEISAGNGKLANGQDATPENVTAMLEQLKVKYPTGMTWGNTGTPNNNTYANGGQMGSDIRTLKNQLGNPLGAVSLTYACGGFMCLISDAIFGTTGAPCREVANVEDLRPGDMLVSYDKTGEVTHCSIVLAVGAPQANSVLGGYSYWVTTTDGNANRDANDLNGKIKWNIDHSVWNGFGSTNYNIYQECYYRAFTRYPD